MQKIDPAFLYELGPSLRRVREVTKETPVGWGYFVLQMAKEQIEQVMEQSVYSHLLRNPTRASALALTGHIDTMCQRPDRSEEDWRTKPFLKWDVTKLHEHYSKFETLLLGDLQASALYLVVPRGGFDTNSLTDVGEALFSSDVGAKVPRALPDLKQAARCIAFDLPTAAGFHLHRAHESVLRVYWDYVTGGAERPQQGNMGVYLHELENLKKGRQEVRSHLKSIKDFHRNPLMHPEQSLDSIDEALDLLAAIRCSIGYMMKEIPANGSLPLLQNLLADAAAAGLEVHQHEAEAPDATPPPF